MKVLLALIAGLVAVNAQFTPQAAPICAPNGVIAGPGAFLPHETYCQLYYQCNLEHAYTMPCPAQTVFNPALPGCLPSNNLQFATGFCPNWQCQVGIKYPDICCGRYWTCINQIFIQQDCPLGQVFDMSSGYCQQDNGQCLDNQFCELNRKVPPTDAKCTLGEVPGDTCKFTMFGAPGNMSCPAGTEFNKAKCGCVHSQLCDNSLPNFAPNKAPATGCQASYRTDFETGLLNAYSDKMNHMFVNAFYSQAKLDQNRDAVIIPNTQTELYSYYYVRNQLVSPMAMEIIFKIDQNAQPFDLITNAAPIHLPQKANECLPTFSVKVSPNYNRMDFEVLAKSGDSTAQETLRISGTGNTGTNNYVKFVLAFSGGLIKAAAFDMGPQGTNSQGYSIGSADGVVDLGTQIQVNECGLTIGHSMAGKIKKWAMYEGCTTPNTIMGNVGR